MQIIHTSFDLLIVLPTSEIDHTYKENFIVLQQKNDFHLHDHHSSGANGSGKRYTSG